MLALMTTTLIAGAASSDFRISLAQIILASLTIAVSLAILALYVRDKDQYFVHDTIRTQSGPIQLCLCEPTAFEKWQNALIDPSQTIKIRSSQAFGATCMGGAMLMLLVLFEPFWRISF
jgi:hypothetical protein